MRKWKSPLLLALLFIVAWAATSDAKTATYVFVGKIRIEGPNFVVGTGTVAPLALLLALPVLLWLQRDQIGRILAGIGAAGSLLFCLESAQVIWWSGQLLVKGANNLFPVFGIAIIHQALWDQLIRADVSFALGALSLWLCARAAGPKPARPIAGWSDWEEWNSNRSADASGLADSKLSTP